jgi:hypothetical protein
MAKGCDHWHAPVGGRRAKDPLTHAAGVQPCAGWLRALVEQAIRIWQRLGAASLARAVMPGAGYLPATAAPLCLGWWLHRVPM